MLIALGALIVVGSVHAEEPFAPRLGQAPVPQGRTRDKTTDSPAKIDSFVDFSATQTPLDPKAAPARVTRAAGRVDRPVDEPVSAGVTNRYATRSEPHR